MHNAVATIALWTCLGKVKLEHAQWFSSSHWSWILQVSRQQTMGLNLVVSCPLNGRWSCEGLVVNYQHSVLMMSMSNLPRQIQGWYRVWTDRFARFSLSSSGCDFPCIETRLLSPAPKRSPGYRQRRGTWRRSCWEKNFSWRRQSGGIGNDLYPFVRRSPGDLLWSYLNASLLLWFVTFFS